MHFGVSGGNVNDITNRFCCSGTLGSLVADSSNVLYILSNNHVLARADQATPGEAISQPGLIENHCQPPTTVANFTAAPRLDSNVDVAIATLIPGMMDSSGYIEGIGTISSTPVAPAVLMGVAKSGRTTGTTVSSIESIDTSATLRYQRRCGQERTTFYVSYTNQVFINNSMTFSAEGDSGSLIVTNIDHVWHPVALLVGGGHSLFRGTYTIANPIDEVLSKVGDALGRSVHFVGGAAEAQAPAPPRGQTMILPQQAVDRARPILERNRGNLMSQPAVIGVGLGASETNSSEAAIVVYVDETASVRPQLPAHIDNVPVRVILTGPFVAF